MTEGSISQKIIFFAIPLFLGNLFQQLYNTADSLIVGNFLGSNALAAVSSSGNLIFLMVGFINGIAMGAGVVIPMIVMLCDWCLFRVSYITVAVRILPDIRVIFWAYPLTWGISSAIFLYLFLRGKWVYGFEKS